MCEIVVSSYSKIQPRGRFKAKSRTVVEAILQGQLSFHRKPICAGKRSYGLFSSQLKGYPTFNLTEKQAVLHLLLRTARIQGRAYTKLLGSTCQLSQFEIYQTVKASKNKKLKINCCSSDKGTKSYNKDTLSTHLTLMENILLRLHER